MNLNHNNSKKIFIVGSGRSGTHWLGYILDDHPDITVSIEKKQIFNKVTEMALNPNSRKDLFAKLLNLYNRESLKCKTSYYADKSHPNLWLVEALASIYPDAYFIGIQRNPYATVASMLKHGYEGVLKWHKEYTKYPIPNKFLGITSDNIKNYEDFPIAKKCALRWLAHKNRMDQIQKEEKYKLHVVKYEDLITDTNNEVRKIKEFLEIKEDMSIPNVKKESLNKWKEQLTKEEINQVYEIVGIGPDEYI
ncbi:sulfotransferase [Pontibacillus salicampi]|uniref:Sulfotransferase n=1 Tax=Pontibacillus salicampi TaxID=1449801 RepID=A0ABV6LSS6_9BACI